MVASGALPQVPLMPKFDFSGAPLLRSFAFRGLWSTLLLTGSLCLGGCSDDDRGSASPEELCHDVCARNKCTRDPTLPSCESNCLRWHDRCPGPASIYHQCYLSQSRADLICDMDRTRLADTLCENAQEDFEQCLSGE